MKVFQSSPECFYNNRNQALTFYSCCIWWLGTQNCSFEHNQPGEQLLLLTKCIKCSFDDNGLIDFTNEQFFLATTALFEDNVLLDFTNEQIFLGRCNNRSLEDNALPNSTRWTVVDFDKVHNKTLLKTMLCLTLPMDSYFWQDVTTALWKTTLCSTPPDEVIIFDKVHINALLKTMLSSTKWTSQNGIKNSIF